MLGKLLKHEFIAMRRSIPLVFLAALGATMLFILSFWLRSEAVSIIMAVVMGITYGVLLVACVATVVSRYVKNLYGNEGYLTHTLPVSNWQLLGSKLISGLLWVLISVLMLLVLAGVMVGGLALAGQISMEGFSIADIFRQMLANMNYSAARFWLTIVPQVSLWSIVGVTGSLAMMYFSITLAHAKWFSRHVGISAVAIFFVTTFVTQYLSYTFGSWLPLFVSYGPELIVYDALKAAHYVSFNVVSTLVEILIYVGIVCATKRLLDKTLSLR